MTDGQHGLGGPLRVAFQFEIMDGEIENGQAILRKESWVIQENELFRTSTCQQNPLRARTVPTELCLLPGQVHRYVPSSKELAYRSEQLEHP